MQIVLKRWMSILEEYEKSKRKQIPRAFRTIKALCETHHISPKELRKHIGSCKSDVYQYPTCGYVKRIKPEDLVYFQSAKEAQEKGYRPWKVCRPPTKD